jgi:hypothetical protein
MIRSTACAKSAGASTGPMIAGDLPPSSSVTGVRFSAAACITWRPTGVEPVNNRWSKGSCENSLATSERHPRRPITRRRRSIADQLGKQRCGRRGDLRHLDQHPIAGGQRRGERRRGEENRVVPGHDDADGPERLITHLRPARLKPQRNRTPLWPHPAPQVAARMANRCVTRKKLEQACFGSRTMAKIATAWRRRSPAHCRAEADRAPAGAARATPGRDADRCAQPPANGKSALPGYRDEAFAAPFQGEILSDPAV